MAKALLLYLHARGPCRALHLPAWQLKQSTRLAAACIQHVQTINGA
jgi:hypothetical protein